MPGGSSDNVLGSASHDNARSAAAVRAGPELAWSKQLDGQVSAPLISKRRVVVMVDGDETGRHEVVAFSRRSGREVWSRALPGEWPGSFALAGDTVRVVTGEGVLWALDLESGRRLWRTTAENDDFDTSLFQIPVVTVGTTSFVQGTFLYANGRSGRLLWALPSATRAAPAADDRALYVPEEECTVTRLRQSDGLPRWAVTVEECGGTGRRGLMPVVHDGVVHDSDNVSGTAFRARDGLPVGVFSADLEPVVWGSERFALTGGSIQAVEQRSQRIRWVRHRDFALAPVVVGRRVYGSTTDGEVVQMSAGTGRVQWSWSREHDVEPVHTAHVVPPAMAAAHGTLAVPQGHRLVVFE